MMKTMAINRVHIKQYFMGQRDTICRKENVNGTLCIIKHKERMNHCDRCQVSIGQFHDSNTHYAWDYEGRTFYLCEDCHRDKVMNRQVPIYDIETLVQLDIAL